MENIIQKLLCKMQIQGQTHQAAASLETIHVLKSLQTIQVLKYLSKTEAQMSRFALQKPNPIIVLLYIVLRKIYENYCVKCFIIQLSRSLAKGAQCPLRRV